MTTIRPNTRSRARQAHDNLPMTPAAVLPRINSESALSLSPKTPGGETPRAPSPAHSVDVPMRLYRDVVLTRIPSMPGALEATPIAALGPKALQAYETAQKELEHAEPKVEKVLPGKEMNKGKKITFDIQLDRKSDDSSSERSFGTVDSQSGMWTTVQKKRTRTKAVSRENSEERYETSDRNKIEARERVLNLRKPRADSAEPPEEGTSRDKGKAPDPKNWGGVDLQEEEIDLDAQRSALESFRIVREQNPDSGDLQTVALAMSPVEELKRQLES